MLCQIGNAPGNLVGGAVQFGADQAVVAVTKWVAAGASQLIGEVAKGLNDTAKPNLTQTWFLDHYRTMASIAAVLMLPLLLASVLQGVIRQDVPQILKSAFLYVPLAIFVTGIAVTVTGWTLDATDGMSQLVSQGMGDNLTTFLGKVGTIYVPAQITAAGAGAATGSAGVTATPLFILFLGALITAVGGFLIFIELLIRDAAVYVSVLFLPLVFAGLVWPAAAHWSKRLVETLVAIILSKFVIVAVLSLAAAGLASTGDQGQFQLLLVGSVLFLLAAFAPYTLFRLIPVLETAAMHQFQGQGQRGVSSAMAAPQSAGSIYSRIMQSGSSGGAGGVPVATEGGSAAAKGGGAAATGAEAGATAAGGAATGGVAIAAEAGVKAAGAVANAGGRQVEAATSMAPGGGNGSGAGAAVPVASPASAHGPESALPPTTPEG
ncbi:MAG: hypothetical protein ACYDGR_16585 [Candidatus Dormibacteria bacterium]